MHYLLLMCFASIRIVLFLFCFVCVNRGDARLCSKKAVCLLKAKTEFTLTACFYFVSIEDFSLCSTSRKITITHYSSFSSMPS